MISRSMSSKNVCSTLFFLPPFRRETDGKRKMSSHRDTGETWQNMNGTATYFTQHPRWASIITHVQRPRFRIIMKILCKKIPFRVLMTVYGFTFNMFAGVDFIKFHICHAFLRRRATTNCLTQWTKSFERFHNRQQATRLNLPAEAEQRWPV